MFYLFKFTIVSAEIPCLQGYKAVEMGCPSNKAGRWKVYCFCANHVLTMNCGPKTCGEL